MNWLRAECGLDQSGAEQTAEYVSTGRAILGAIPTQQTVIAERFFDESGGMQLIIHAPFGARINKAWGLALRKRFCRSFNFELQAAATDNGLNISLSEQHSFPLADVFHFLHPNSVQHVLEQAVLPSPLFTTRWRWDAGRSLALLRFRGGKKVPPNIQRMRADDLLAAVFPEALACPENLEGEIALSDHPLIRETMKDVLTEALDIEGLQRVLTDMGEGRIRCIAVDTPVPSQFSHVALSKCAACCPKPFCLRLAASTLRLSPVFAMMPGQTFAMQRSCTMRCSRLLRCQFLQTMQQNASTACEQNCISLCRCGLRISSSWWQSIARRALNTMA